MSDPTLNHDESSAEGLAGTEVAIIGMSCLFPGAPDLEAFWRNILGKVDAVTDPPPEARETGLYFDPDSSESDRVYCRRGGYLGSLSVFDPLPHGIPPVAVGGEPDQWLALQLARDALADAGSLQLDETVRRRTAVILGKGTYLNAGNAIAVQHGFIINQTLEILRTLHPEYTEADLEVLRRELKKGLPSFSPETMPGLVPNVIVGRIANRLDLMGPSYTVDAACASSLVAVQHAMTGLASGELDLVLAGGSQVWIPMPTLSIFCQLGALSRRQQIRPFDKNADGTLLGEGIGMLVLKRLADAERDGDRIYATIRGVGIASDGRGASVMAPRVEGEELALRRAYATAGVAPETVGLIEAHGTGTPIGDAVEISALTRVFGTRDGGLPRCALGSVKSMISHPIPAAGVAGIIKVALALYHRVLPPTLHCDEPNPKLGLEKTPFYIAGEARPWIQGAASPRRAGVNAFGFGGINAHAVLEEHRPTAHGTIAKPSGRNLSDHRPDWDSEVCILGAESGAELLEEVRRLSASLDAEGSSDRSARLMEIGYRQNRDLMSSGSASPHRLAVVATSVPDLREKLDRAAGRLAAPGGCRQIRDGSGIYYATEPMGREGKLAFLFPGEGSQYPNMMADLCLHFPEVRECFDQIDRVYHGHPRGYVPSDYIFPRPAPWRPPEGGVEGRLWDMVGAVEAVLTANQAALTLVKGLGLRPNVIVGHSTGEFSALRAAGILDPDREEFSELCLKLHSNYEEAAQTGVPRAVLLAVGADRDRVEAIAREAGGALYLAMDNCPHQAILVGEEPAAERAAEIVRREGLMAERLNFDRAYHTPLFAPYVDHLRRVFAEAPIRPARLPIYSCTTAAPYPDDPAAIRKLMLDHWLLPVQFRRTIDVLYEDGVRLFVEVGPRGNLSAFVDDILRGRRFCAIPANVQRRSGIAQLNHLAALLTVHGVDLDLMALYRRRQPRLAPSEGDEPAEVPSRPAARLKLDTGFPAMGVSEEFARRLRGASASPRPEPDRAGAPGDGLIRALRDSAPFSAASSPPDVEVPGGALARDFLRAMDRLLAARGASGEDTRPAAMPMATEGRRAVEPAPLPLLGRVHCETPGVSLVARRTFDPDVDLYLRDHTLGRDVSEADPDLMAMAVMPLAMSLEILAEAAARLVPGQTVIGLRDVRAHRWIAFDGGPQELEVTARIHPDAPDRPVVQLRNRTEDLRSNATSPSPVVEATVLLAGSYPEPPPGGSGGPRDGRPSQLRPDRLYAEIMFHGPRWQGVVSIDRVDGGGAAATLRVLPFGELIRDVPEPHFVLDPVVLDAAGQVVGFWTAERLATGRVVFPFRLEALDVFGPHRRPGEALASLASIRLEGERLVRSDIEVRGPEGRPWMRLVGWEDRRFDLPPALEPLMIPTWRDLSEPWALPIRHGPGARPLVGRRLRLGLAPDRSLWGRVWAARVLTRDERETFRGLEGPEARQLEWLAGRTAAKEAVAELLRDHRGRNPPPAEIEIRVDDSGRLVAEGSWLDPGDDPPVVEIRRGNGHLVALAGFTPAPALALSSASETEEMAGTGTSWESQFRSTDREGGT